MALRDYQPVDDRLREWWSDHKDGRVITSIDESHGEQRWTILAELYRDSEDDRPYATGRAYGDPAGSSGAQATNPLEDAETSAIGRALANAGYSPKGARPSAEEMAVAQNRQAAREADAVPATNGQPAEHPVQTIRERIKAAGLTDAFVRFLDVQFGVAKLDELDAESLAKVLAATSSEKGLATIAEFAEAEAVDA